MYREALRGFVKVLHRGDFVKPLRAMRDLQNPYKEGTLYMHTYLHMHISVFPEDMRGALQNP